MQCVEAMLKLQGQLAATQAVSDKTLIQRQIDATDRRIDRLVYEFYGFTDAEMAAVENSGKEILARKQ